MAAMNRPCCERMALDLNQVCELHPDRAACPDALKARRDAGGQGLLLDLPRPEGSHLP
jgi:hypothetical protein